MSDLHYSADLSGMEEHTTLGSSAAAWEDCVVKTIEIAIRRSKLYK